MGTLNTNEYEITITETHSITIYAPNAEEANDRVSDMLAGDRDEWANENPRTEVTAFDLTDSPWLRKLNGVR